MKETEGNLQIGAYFYPLTQSCELREERARQLTSSLDTDEKEEPVRVPNELILAQHAQPLFAGHDQPRIYCIPDFKADTLSLQWDDADPSAFLSQVMLARDYGISYFIFDSYRGIQRGKQSHELAAVTRTTRRAMQLLGSIGMRYARMETLERPRALLPIPTRGREEYFFTEPDRAYDVTPKAARHLVDSNIQDWANPAYLHMGVYSHASERLGIARPYVPILMPNIPEEQKRDTIKVFINELLEYAFHRYQVIPYLAGVMRHEDDLEHWLATEVEAVTNYLELPIAPSRTISRDQVPPIQHYDELMDIREEQWSSMIDHDRGKVIIPSVPVGWDASPRGEPGYRLEEVHGVHPYTPLVIGSTAVRFAQGLQTVVDRVQERIPRGEQFVTIWAWNEVTEGGTILPRIIPGQTIDTSYLEAVRNIVSKEAVASADR